MLLLVEPKNRCPWHGHFLTLVWLQEKISPLFRKAGQTIVCVCVCVFFWWQVTKGLLWPLHSSDINPATSACEGRWKVEVYSNTCSNWWSQRVGRGVLCMACVHSHQQNLDVQFTIVRYDMCLGVIRHTSKTGKPPFTVNCCTVCQWTQKQQTLSHKILPLLLRAQMSISCSHLFIQCPDVISLRSLNNLLVRQTHYYLGCSTTSICLYNRAWYSCDI